ncbi:MAG: RidA family protein [Alphaproteobacteria bacterium]|nr:RidA family protein [Alphaproteobacteria bacterium]
MAKRESMHIPGLVRHKNPISHCTRIGNMLFSGAIGGYGKDGGVPDTFDAQVTNAFANLKILVEGAGFGLGDVAKVTVFLKDTSNRDAVNREWLKLFPEEHDRPARHAIKADLDGKTLVQLEIVAVR